MNIPMDPTQGAAYLLAALVLPLLVAIVKQAGLPNSVNAILALIVYAIFAVVGAAWSGTPLTSENLVPLFIAAALSGRLAYSMFWSLVGGDQNGQGSIDDRLTLATSLKK